MRASITLIQNLALTLRTTIQSVTDRQTDGRHYDANSWSYCEAVPSAKSL